MNSITKLLSGSLVLLGIHAQATVTPAHLALNQVKQYLDAQTENEIYRTIPPVKAASYIIQFQSNLGRGKFSTDEFGFTDFFGTTQVMMQVGVSETYRQVTCSTFAHAQVVPFAKQEVPILEEEVNEQQLILKKHQVRCHLDF